MLYINTNLGKKDLVPALVGQYTVQFVFKVVLEVWEEITKLVQGGLTIISEILREMLGLCMIMCILICILSQNRPWTGLVGAVA